MSSSSGASWGLRLPFSDDIYDFWLGTSSSPSIPEIGASDADDTIKLDKKQPIQDAVRNFHLLKEGQREERALLLLLDRTLDQAMTIVEVAIEMCEKLDDDTKWATMLVERLTSEFDPLTKENIGSGKGSHKDNLISAIVAYLGTTRKLLFEAA